MKLLIEHIEERIDKVSLIDVVHVQDDSRLVNVDLLKHAELAGRTLPESEYYKAVGEYEAVTLVIGSDGSFLTYPQDTVAILPVDADTIVDFLTNWPEGKYQLDGGMLVLAPGWVEPTITVLAVDNEQVPIDLAVDDELAIAILGVDDELLSTDLAVDDESLPTVLPVDDEPVKSKKPATRKRLGTRKRPAKGK